MSILIGNICAFVAACFTFLSAWSRDRKRIYLYQAAQCGVLAIANVFFASLSGVTTYALCTARNLLLGYERFTARRCAVFVAAVTVLGICANNRGLVGLLPVVTTAVYTVGCYYARRTPAIKWNLIANLILWAIYDAFILDLVSCAVDTVSAIAALVSIVRENKTQTDGR
ncbi:MAG: YgjV family protein [Oscillospiraceae bacterium]|nr:YgjV family protein [Oscillospiraceae bacterium]